MTIRKYRQADAAGLAELFWESVRHGAQPHYSEAERRSWAPSVPDAGEWHERVSGMFTLVAEDASGLCGFMTLETDGHIDLAYVRPDLIGKGVAKRLYAQIEDRAYELGISLLYSEASHLARPFFEKHGWSLVATQQVHSKGGLLLTNHRMQKMLGSDATR